MAQQEITKERIKNLLDYRDGRRVHQNGSILTLPKGTRVSTEARKYAKKRKCDIRIE
jgi:hypothetical protein